MNRRQILAALSAFPLAEVSLAQTAVRCSHAVIGTASVTAFGNVGSRMLDLALFHRTLESVPQRNEFRDDTPPALILLACLEEHGVTARVHEAALTARSRGLMPVVIAYASTQRPQDTAQARLATEQLGSVAEVMLQVPQQDVCSPMIWEGLTLPFAEDSVFSCAKLLPGLQSPRLCETEAFVGYGHGDTFMDAVHQAVEHPLLGRQKVVHSSGLLALFSQGSYPSDLTMHDLYDAAQCLRALRPGSNRMTVSYRFNQGRKSKASVHLAALYNRQSQSE